MIIIFITLMFSSLCKAEINFIDLPVRYIKQAGGYDTSETDNVYLYKTWKLNLNKTALIIIDAWNYDDSLNEGSWKRIQANIDNKLIPLVDILHSHDVLIIHIPHSRELSKSIKPLDNEYVLTTSAKESSESQKKAYEDLKKILEIHNIDTLLYAGYCTNICMMFRPTGIIAMHELGYPTILIRDCTIALETRETMNGEWMKEVSINIIELNCGPSTTSEDIKKALFGYEMDLQTGNILLMFMATLSIYILIKLRIR